MPQSDGYNRAEFNSDPSSERLERAARLRFPQFFKRALPPAVIRLLREIKACILMRTFPHSKKFEQTEEDAQAAASISIIIPVHDSPKVTGRCFASLERFATRAEVIVVDDGSLLAETCDLIENFCRRNGWRIIRHEKALGHSRANEVGALLATRPYLCLLNSDTVVTPWCWQLIKQAFELDQAIAVAGPSTSHSANPQALPLANFLRYHLNESQICEYARRLAAECSNLIITDLPWVCGFAFFIRRSLWEELGGFDPNLPDYGNERELSNRVREKGYRTVWVRNAYIHHFAGESYKTAIGLEAIHARSQAADQYIDQKHRAPVS
jgi:GT2 family glycosyltransferase